MGSKLVQIAMIVGGVIAVCLIIWGLFPVIQNLVGVAQADPSAANYTFYKHAIDAAPLWLYGLPIMVGGVMVVIVLRAPEKR